MIGFLLLEVTLSPIKANASLLASLFGSTPQTEARENIRIQESDLNSQNVSLLEASTLLTKSKNEESSLSENVSAILNDSTISPNSSLLKDDDVGDGIPTFDQISVYMVKSGDTLSKVADMFGVSPNTIIWSNDLKSKKLTVGETLIILPISGVKHTVKKGDSLKSIASSYKVEVADIIEYNNLSEDEKLKIGDDLIIPGGEIVQKVEPKPIKNTGSSNIASLKNGATSNYDVSGYFTHPLPNSRRVRGLSRTHHGVDFAAPTGTSIYAAASGRVIFAKYGWNGRYGNMVILSHDNGSRTLYAHMSRIGIEEGSYVEKGQVIGYVGNTGRSTGPHLHFEVLGAKNSF